MTDTPFGERISFDFGDDYFALFNKGGYIWHHRRPGRQFGPMCEGWVNPSTHQITYATMETPPTITPSLDCSICGRHGFVTDGKWIESGEPPAPTNGRQR